MDGMNAYLQLKKQAVNLISNKNRNNEIEAKPFFFKGRVNHLKPLISFS